MIRTLEQCRQVARSIPGTRACAVITGLVAEVFRSRGETMKLNAEIEAHAKGVESRADMDRMVNPWDDPDCPDCPDCITHLARIRELEGTTLIMVNRISELNAEIEKLEEKIAPVPAHLFKTWKHIRSVEKDLRV